MIVKPRIRSRLLAFVAFGVFCLGSSSSLSAGELAERIMGYFPGKWIIKTADGDVGGEVEWSRVAGGKAVSGSGKQEGQPSFSMAGWDAEKELWIHNWFESDGTHGYLEVESFADGVYKGKAVITSGDGKVASGPWQNKILDKNSFEITTPSIQGGIEKSYWFRADANETPRHVKDAIGRLVGEWSCETTVDGETVKWELECQWSPDESSITYNWSGTDIVTGQTNSGSGILGWDAVKQLVVELEIDADGSTYRSTHHILENGDWTSPTKGSTIIDGKRVHVESHRVFTWPSNDEWRGRDTKRMIDGVPVEETTTVCKRKN
ncbi:hypothetical protein NZK35_31835 [Stieleria sp. ICT_E10.1]|uniref:hypothetical protein n=1 Tax=Stieleria sedimenti TaxID=2976331 RepID=UPI00217F6B49|nr:hypothetical protein [Stieleria sedimenti]MCS7471269.1 hypothetical protein [Stieleria sedimenti]